MSLSDTYFDFSEGTESSSGLFEIYQSARSTLVVDEPSIIDIRITGDAYKDLPSGYVLVPKLDITRTDGGLPPRAVFWDSDTENNERFLQSSYIVSPGTYDLTIEAGINGWTSENAFEDQIYLLDLQLTKQQTIQELPWVARFNEWLASIELQEEFGIAAAIEGPQFDRYGSYFESADQSIASMEVWRHRDVNYWEVDMEERLKKLRDQRFFDDTLFIVFNNTLPREKMGSLEGNFYQTHGETIWDKAFQKISLFAGIPTRRIFAIVNVWCSGGQVMQVAPGVVRRFGEECMSASAAQPSPEWSADRVASPATDNEIEEMVDFGKAVESFLDAEVTAVGGRISYLERGETYIEAIVDSVRGWVIDGGQEWERVQVSFALFGGERKTVRIFIDGMLASGIGLDPPPESKYTYSMEPEHALALSNHARSTLDRFLSVVQ